jgi:phosphoribosylformylglycinamidine synthase
MWQFSQTIAGLVDGCRALGTPVTGGNVSFYNQTGTVPILPTPIIGVLGVIDDVTRRTPVGFRTPGDAVYLLGETRDELAGSAWADVIHDHLGGLPPAVDFAHEQRLASLLIRASRRGALSSAHDLSDGGLAQALVEACLRHGLGVEVGLPIDVDPFVMLFSESSGRVLVSVHPDAEEDLTGLCAEAGIHQHRLGTVRDVEEAELHIAGQLILPLAAIRKAWSAPLREVFAG